MIRLASHSIRLILWLAFSIIFYQKSVAQLVKLSGKVVDTKTRQAIPYANVYLIHGRTGEVCDENGNFIISGQSNDSLRFSSVGFESAFLRLTKSQDSVRIELSEFSRQLNEVEITGYKDPGKALMKKVIAKKAVNDPERLRSFERKEYLKTEIDLLNLESTSSKNALQTAARIYNSFSPDSALRVLPVYFSEQYSSVYHTRSGNTSIKTLLATKTLNLSTDQFAPKFDKFNIVLSIYDAIIPILKTSFVGPVSDLGLSFYHFEIIDTLAGNVHRTFVIRFAPNSVHENTFSGTLWVEDDTYAVKKVNLKTGSSANLNFVRSIDIEQQYQRLPYPEVSANVQKTKTPPDSVWMLSVNQTKVNFHNGLQLLGLPLKADTTGKQVMLTNKSTFSDFRLNAEPSDPKPVSHEIVDLTEEQRLTPLTAQEQAIYATVDSLRSNKSFSRSIKLTSLVATGYWDFANRLRIGPVSSIVSGSYVEGLRIRSSVWTLEGFNKQWNLNGYVAYGTKDNRWKGGIGLKYVPSRAPYRKTEILWRRDYDVLTENDDELDTDNIFSLGLRKKLPPYQIFTEQIKVIQEYDIDHNWSAKLFLSYRKMDPTFSFRYYPEDVLDSTLPLMHKLSTTEAGINFRYGHNERTTIFNYDKIRIYTRFPVLNFGYVHGFEMLKSNYFNYHKLSFGISQEFNMPIKGSFYYNLSTGKTFGVLPYLLLNVPRGNPYYVSSKYAFNNMRPYEFAADQYASLMLRYSLGGLILDHLPLLQKLKIRERLLANFYSGSMTAANHKENLVNSIGTTGRIPYAEAGFGFENILNVFTIDAVWRLTHNNPQSGSSFGIFTGIKIVF